MPERTCVACRRKGPAETFFRMVADPAGGVACELDSRLPGRGAHCCFSAACLGRALEGGTLHRVLRKEVAPPLPESVRARVEALLRQRVEGMLGAAWRKGALAAGREAAWRALAEFPGGQVFAARDLGEAGRREVSEKAPGAGALPLTKEELGRLLGRLPVGVLFVSDPSLAAPLALRAAQWAALEGI